LFVSFIIVCWLNVGVDAVDKVHVKDRALEAVAENLATSTTTSTKQHNQKHTETVATSDKSKQTSSKTTASTSTTSTSSSSLQQQQTQHPSLNVDHNSLKENKKKVGDQRVAKPLDKVPEYDQASKDELENDRKAKARNHKQAENPFTTNSKAKFKNTRKMLHISDDLPDYAKAAKQKINDYIASGKTWPGQPDVMGCTPLECEDWCSECAPTSIVCTNNCFNNLLCRDDCEVLA